MTTVPKQFVTVNEIARRAGVKVMDVKYWSIYEGSFPKPHQFTGTEQAYWWPLVYKWLVNTDRLNKESAK